MLGTSPQVALTPAGPGRRPSRTLGRLTRAARHPGEGIAVGWSLVRGWWYKLSYPARGIRFRAGRNFRVRGTLSVRGPGAVVMGDDVCVEGFVTPWTYAADAVIAAAAGILPGTEIGANSVVGFGAVCAGRYPASVVIAGNPARVVRAVDS